MNRAARLKQLILACAVVSCVWGQSESAPRCEPIPEVRRAIEEIRFDSAHKLPERLQWQAAEYERWLRKHPREAELHYWSYWLYRNEMPDNARPARQRYLRQAMEKPQDPLALYMAGVVLHGTDTPRAIETLETAKRLNPSYARTFHLLASIYSTGKYADLPKAADNIDAYFKACPESLDPAALGLLARNGRPETVSAARRSLRARLEKETDPATLKRFAELWTLEFKTTPAAEHPMLRQLVAADVKRLEAANPRPDSEWLSFLAGGMRQAAASDEEQQAMDDRIVREFPHSEEACSIVSARWDDAHPQPQPAASPETWDAYTREHLAAVQAWMNQFPTVSYLTYAAALDQQYLQNPDLALAEVALRREEEESGPSTARRLALAEQYLKWKTNPQRAVGLAEGALAKAMKRQRNWLGSDALSAEQIAPISEVVTGEQLHCAQVLARAYRRSGVGAKASGLKAPVLAVQAKGGWMKSNRFAALGEIAAAEGKYSDALAYYRAALDARAKPPQKVRGRMEDKLLSQAKEIWTLSNGSEDAWVLWSKPEDKQRETVDGVWEEPKRPLPAFELTDLGGRKWSLKELEGKTLFINLWATWCGPCQAELPQLQKLYEMAKAHPDVAVLSLNVDEEAGTVEPFMREKGYSFPALLASRYVSLVLGSPAIPQNWIVDSHGMWRLRQNGFGGGEADWVSAMWKRIDSVK